jgi:hypothetical protein
MEIGRLVGRVKEICSDPRYVELGELWGRHERLEIVERIPVCLEVRDSMWGRFLGYDLQALTADRIRDLVRFELEQKIYRHEVIRDDTVVSRELRTGAYHVALTSRTMFGARRTSIPDTEGWRVEPIVRTEADLASLRPPEIRWDPEASRRRAEEFLDAVHGDLPVQAPRPGAMTRGPLDLAVELRGWEQLMLDFHDRPGFVHDLMRAITDARIGYEKERARLLGIDLGTSEGGLWEDDVNCDVLSPRAYEEFVFPYECEMARLYGRVTFHSCGKLTPVLDLVVRIPGLHRLYFSEPWTDLAAAHAAARNRMAIRVDMNPATRIGVPRHELLPVLDRMAAVGRGCVLQVHMASARTGTPEQVLQWVRIATEVLGSARAA